MENVQEVKQEIKKPVNETLELAKELGLKKQVWLLEYEDWKKNMPYKEVMPEQVKTELYEMADGKFKREHDLCYTRLDQTKVQDYNKKLPMSALIRMKEAKEYGFDEYEVWQIAAKVDPVLVGVKYEGVEEVIETPEHSGTDYWQRLQQEMLRQQAASKPYYGDTAWTYLTYEPPIDHMGSKWYDGGSPEPKKLTRKVNPHYFELCRWV